MGYFFSTLPRTITGGPLREIGLSPDCAQGGQEVDRSLGCVRSLWGNGAIYQQSNLPTPTPSFQYKRLWFPEMVIKNVDQATTKCSLENPFVESLDFHRLYNL